MESLYVLQLTSGKYYVGKTTDVIKRFEQHKTGSGSAWTKKYKPISLMETRPITSPHDETNTTKDLMKKYGIDNVRGGAYTSVDLPAEQEDLIRHELRAASDSCYKCGKSGHFATQCKRKSSFTANCSCGRDFLDFDEFMSHCRSCKTRNAAAKQKEEVVHIYECRDCKAEFKTKRAFDSHECYIEDPYQCGVCYRDFRTRAEADNCACYRSTKKSSAGKCYRCGRAGHYSPDCYASRHVKGYELD